jgi:hypothetical protein
MENNETKKCKEFEEISSVTVVRCFAPHKILPAGGHFLQCRRRRCWIYFCYQIPYKYISSHSYFMFNSVFCIKSNIVAAWGGRKIWNKWRGSIADWLFICNLFKDAFAVT